MDYAACHVVYVDRRVSQDRHEDRKTQPTSSKKSVENVLHPPYVQHNLDVLLSVFNRVHLCSNTESALAKIRDLDSLGTDCTPTLAFFETYLHPSDDMDTIVGKTQQLSDLLSFITSAESDPNISCLNVAIVALGPQDLLGNSETTLFSLSENIASQSSGKLPFGEHKAVQTDAILNVDPKQMMSCLQAGAVDAIPSPFTKERVEALATHAYRAHIQGLREQPAFLDRKNTRKRSWVGVDEAKPYAYLREEMVSTLMGNICKPDALVGSAVSSKTYHIESHRARMIAEAIGKWAFPAHELSDDELVHAAFLILKHALEMPELEKWRMPDDEIKDYLIACRSAYNAFVLYHNFRHVVDVLQAIYYFLLQIGTLPPYPPSSHRSHSKEPVSPIAALLKPFDAFVLLVSAIGHDVGHPGVNNAFLVALKSPLAQLYNDNSVLEAFHCAAYSQILRRHWNITFQDAELRKLLIRSILATDMQMHFKYMTDLGNLQEKLHDNKGTDGWSPQELDEHRALACGLLIKCADISNVARPFAIAAQWSDILQLEFARQGEMENDVGIPTTLFGGPPELGNITKLANSQIGFMNIFAHPLFNNVSDILPAMRFAVDEIKANQNIWQQKVDEEKVKEGRTVEVERYVSEGFQSPRSGSPDRMFANAPELSHPEGLPASTSPAESQSFPVDVTDKAPKEQNHVSTDERGTAVVDEQNRYSNASLSGLTEALHVSTAQSQEPSRRGSAAPFPPTFPESSRRSSSAFPYANIRGQGLNPTQLGLGSSNPSIPHPMTSENSAPAAVSTFNENIFFDTSSAASTAPGTASSSGGGGAGSSHRGDKGADSDTSTSQLTHHGNFSRPLSTRHSAQPSFTRSSVPSGNTYASTTLPTSPTDTHATSFFTEGSDGPDPMDTRDLESPRGEYRTSGFRGGGFSNSAVRSSPTKYEARSGMFSSMNGHADSNDRTVRKKGSRFRFDFWKKRKGEESNS